MIPEPISKSELRAQINRLKAHYSPETLLAKSSIALRDLEALEAFQRANTVLAYWSIEGEVQTHAFVNSWAQQKTIVLPIVEGENLVLGLFSGMDCMEPSPPFGILEPTNTPRLSIDDIDLVIVPGVAFDSLGNRLGRGKGFYDRLLRDIKATKAGICFDFQMVPMVPTTENDIRMDIVVTG